MSVAVTPETFSLVSYDGSRIAALIAEVAARVGLPDELGITVEVDERTPLARTELASIDPVVLAVEGGAFEDVRRPRQLSEEAVAVTALRLLSRVRDRRDPAFGPAPAEDEVTLAQADAWDAYSLGRAARLGYSVSDARWRYRFRTRHGFSDVADLVFDRLWAADGLTWADLVAACAETEAARVGAAT